jgi:glycosyltransferase involved in cell wall biosynthesis
MKISIVTPELPFPPTQGGRIRMHAILRFLAERHEVQLISTAIEPFQRQHRAALEALCEEVHVLKHFDSPVRRAARLVRSVITQQPFVVFKHNSRGLGHEVARHAREFGTEVVLVEFHYQLPSVLGVGKPVVVDFHNVDYLLYDRFASQVGWNVKRIHGLVQRSLMQRFERFALAHATKCVTVSTKDREALVALDRDADIRVVPNGVDVSYFTASRAPSEHVEVLYVGTMQYFPNDDAARYLLDAIMPRVWATHPHTRVRIVGRGPSLRLQRYQRDPRVVVTGEVPDVRDHFAAARVLAVPLRIGGGTRLKLLEAAASALPAVSSTLGAEGIGFRNGEEIILADNVDEFAAAIVHILDAPEEAVRIGNRARVAVQREHDWQVVLPTLEATLMESVEARAR